jgi:hypothetical protein
MKHFHAARIVLWKERGVMLQKRSMIQLSLVGAIALALLLGLFLTGRKRMSKPDPAGVARHSLKTPAEDVQKYWTAEKMREAKPVPMPHVSDVKEGKKRRQRPAKPQKSENPEKPQA